MLTVDLLLLPLDFGILSGTTNSFTGMGDPSHLHKFLVAQAKPVPFIISKEFHDLSILLCQRRDRKLDFGARMGQNLTKWKQMKIR